MQSTGDGKGGVRANEESEGENDPGFDAVSIGQCEVHC